MRFPSAPAVAALVAASAVSHAHVVLENPRPFKFPDYGASNPIDPDGSNFPCKKLAGQTLEVDGNRTVMAVGEPQVLSFSGAAVHGGGSCQLSLTRDLQPTPDSRWMVIHSIEGGCPARNQRGNLDGPNVDVYGFAIPQAIPPGDYTFAWTWLNRIGGQPEFYMNCAPITVVAAATKQMKGGKRAGAAGRRAAAADAAVVSKRDDADTDFPELFMANMGALSDGCTTGDALTQQLAIRFPNPGASVEHPEGEDELVAQPCDGNPRAAAAGSPPPSSPPGPGDGAEPTSPVEPEPVPDPSPTTTVTVQPPDATLITPTPPTVPIDTPTSTASEIEPVPTTGRAACTEGYLMCMDDGLGFKTCTGGLLRPNGDAVPVPGGYSCVPGEGVGLDLRPI
ncbi:hypothetical protein DL766_008446 [Monosporascus sp. MC13-8B]|uniref:Chitin-binding type-4 domain-containing protein n=1 Tax=Monosporascus cannonballus TaxID=155416 RepID=A0ABY0HE16_9PEZI|nr:hypothetical protein DL762_003788 [Monosporascus cannonballus]RYO93542.1 hypothetical protein DL763_004338 [Monosporascus cannonballus]RYP19436.1 hypothetical protein DL766_008446 [Monosporascus sp. MC13-8B]